MLSHGPSKAFLGALCFCLAIALGTVLLSPPYQAPQIEAKDHPDSRLEGQINRDHAEATPKPGGNIKADHRGDEPTEFWTILGRRVKITDTLLVLFTFTLFWATRDLVIEGRRTAERQLRAYPGVVGASVEIHNNRNFHIAVEIVNTSTTPAYKFRYDMAYQLCAVGSTFKFDHVTLSDMQWDMAPHSKTTMRISGDIDEKQTVAVAQMGDVLLFFWGRAEYEDAFGNSRHIEFVYRNGPFKKDVREGRFSSGSRFPYDVWVCTEPEPISYKSN
jgi:hypothetical protein